jgi:nitrile hydratase subunit beta
MNGVHDMGGMQGFGPVRREPNEPVFHDEWEGRVWAINAATTAFGRWTIDAWRYDIETLPPVEYLRMSYYERWLAAMEKRLVAYGFVTADELARGVIRPAEMKPALTVAIAREFARNLPSTEDASVAALFRVGDRVRAKNMNPAGHTRLPRYVRGKMGEIVHDRGVHALPDASAEGRLVRQHLYSVRFAARELWGPPANGRDVVHLDLWDEYLERG